MSKNIQVLKPFYRTQEITKLVAECCDSAWTGIGGKMMDFEEAWKASSGAKTCHMLNSATVGLHLAVLQLKMKYGWSDEAEIITTPLTFVSTNHAILYNDLKPVFADIDQYGCLDPVSIESKITTHTKAILYVGLGGNTGSLREVIALAKKHSLKLILDAAHMAGTKWKDSGMQVGCQDEVDVVVFSGQAVKNLPTADSGWICWNGSDALEMDAQTRKLSWLGIDKDTFSRTNTSQGSYKWYYDVPYLGYKFHSNAVMGCFGLVGLKYLEQDNAYRRYICDIYTDGLKDVVEIVPTREDCISSRHLFQILVDKRDEVMLALNQCGIYPGVHYRENTLYSMYQFGQGTTPNVTSFSNRTITLPVHMHLSVEDARYVVQKLKEILEK